MGGLWWSSIEVDKDVRRGGGELGRILVLAYYGGFFFSMGLLLIAKS